MKPVEAFRVPEQKAVDLMSLKSYSQPRGAFWVMMALMNPKLMIWWRRRLSLKGSFIQTDDDDDDDGDNDDDDDEYGNGGDIDFDWSGDGFVWPPAGLVRC